MPIGSSYAGSPRHRKCTNLGESRISHRLLAKDSRIAPARPSPQSKSHLKSGVRDQLATTGNFNDEFYRSNPPDQKTPRPYSLLRPATDRTVGLKFKAGGHFAYLCSLVGRLP